RARPRLHPIKSCLPHVRHLTSKDSQEHGSILRWSSKQRRYFRRHYHLSTHGRTSLSCQTARSALAFTSVDAEGLLEPAPSQGRDDHGMAAPHPLDPAEIEEALGNRGPERTRDMWAALGPIKTEPASGTPLRKRDPEFVKKTGARGRNCGGSVVDDD